MSEERRLDIQSIILASRHRAIIRARVRRGIIVCGFVLLALIALFPPRRGVETVNSQLVKPTAIPSRRFLFSSKLYEYDYHQPGRDDILTGTQFAAEIDAGRLIAEALLAVVLIGIGAFAIEREPMSKD
jgi:hypothetical protein